LSKKAKYAIHALVHLARHYQEGPILISEISEKQKIPQKFLEAILLELKKDGLLNRKKGKDGGYYLIKSTEEGTMAEVMRSMDGAIALLPCVAYKYYEPCEECKDEKTCGIRSTFSDVRNETVNLLKKSTLAKIIDDEEKLIREKFKNKK